MTITQAESGLSAPNYSAIQNAISAPGFQVLAHIWNHDFVDYMTSGSLETSDFDVGIEGSVIYRNVGNVLQKTDLLTLVTTTITPSAPSGLCANTRFRLFVNATGLYYYANTDAGIVRNTSANFGTSWSGWSTQVASGSQTVWSPDMFVFGIAAASDFLVDDHASYAADMAFDNDRNNHWHCPATTGWVRYDLDGNPFVGTAPTRYTIRLSGGASNMPKSWTFQGSNDASSWTTLDTKTNVSNFSAYEKRTYTFANSTAYRYYRLNVTAINAGSYFIVNELEMHYDEILATIDDFCVTNGGQVFYTILDGGNKTYQLHHYDNAGLSTPTEVHLTFRPRRISARIVNGIMALVVSTEIPGATTYISENNQPVRHVFSAGGILAFRWLNETLSEYSLVDSVDNMDFYKQRDWGMLSTINNIGYICAYSRNGDENNDFGTPRWYTSMDGRNWSNGDIIPLPSADSAIYGMRLFLLGDYLYGVTALRIYRSRSTLANGFSPASGQIDLTPYIRSYKTNQGDMFTSSIELDNAGGEFNNHSIINKNTVIALVHKAGYHSGGTLHLYQQALTEVDDINFNESVPEKTVQLTSRDRMAWMSDKINSEYPRYWDPVKVEVDDFADGLTKTNYGGLSHMTPQDGKLTTENGVLFAGVNGGAGFSSYGLDLWNGIAQVRFKVKNTSPYGKAGIYFRATDVQNFMVVYYDSQDDKLHLSEGRNDINFTWTELKATGSAIGLSGIAQSDWLGIRVKFYFGRIRVWWSANGLEWNEDLDLVHDVNCTDRYYDAPFLKKLNNVPLERGFVGVMGASVQGSNFRSRFMDFQVQNIGSPHTLEDSFKAYAAFAGIHATQFDDVYTGALSGWTLDSGVILT